MGHGEAEPERVSVASLHGYCIRLCEAAGMPGKDAATLAKFMEYAGQHAMEAMEINGLMQFSAPTMELHQRVNELNDGFKNYSAVGGGKTHCN